MVAMAGYDNFGGKGTIGFAVHPQHGLVPAKLRIQVKRLPGQLIRWGILGQKPAVTALTTPGFAGGAGFGHSGQGGIRHSLQPVGSFVHRIGQLGDFGEHIGFKHFQRAL